MLDRRSRGWRRTLAAIGIGAVGACFVGRAAAVGIADIGRVVDVGNLGLRRLLFTARRISMDNSLLGLYRKGIITQETVLQYCTNPEMTRKKL